MKMSFISRWLRLAMPFAVVLSAVCSRAEDAAPKPPDRRELWVPMDKLGRVLDKKAVLLSREQYEALLRDAGVEKQDKIEAPVGVVISMATFRAVPEGRAAAIHGEWIVNVLRDGWNEVPLEFGAAEIGSAKLDGDGVLLPKNAELRVADDAQVQANAAQAAPRPSVLMIRGRGEHRLSLELNAAITSTAGVNTLSMVVPGAASGTFTLALPGGTTMEQSGGALKVSATPTSTTAVLALSPTLNAVTLQWKIAGASAEQIPARAQARIRYTIDAEKNYRKVCDSRRDCAGESAGIVRVHVPAGDEGQRRAGRRNERLECRGRQSHCEFSVGRTQDSGHRN